MRTHGASAPGVRSRVRRRTWSASTIRRSRIRRKGADSSTASGRASASRSATSGCSATMRRALSSDMDFERFRLRRFLEALPPEELDRIDRPVELGEVAALHEGNAKALWLTQAGTERAQLAANVTASRSRLARAFGTTPEKLLAEVMQRLTQAGEVLEVEQAPVQEVVEKDPDLTALPVHLQ